MIREIAVPMKATWCVWVCRDGHDRGDHGAPGASSTLGAQGQRVCGRVCCVLLCASRLCACGRMCLPGVS